MELLTKLVVVLLLLARVNADDIADEGGSMSFENLQSRIKNYEENIKKNEAEMRILENEIADVNMKISHENELRQLNKNSYLSGVLRSALLGIYPTLCLPNESVTGLYDIKLNDESFEVVCDGKIAGPGWIVIQRRSDDNLDFNRGWKEYQNGFGNIGGSYFIGLKKLRQLTSFVPHELYIHLESLNGETRFANYNHFKIEGQNYRLISLGDYNGTAGDAFADSLGNDFLTNEYNRYFFGKTGWWISYDQSGIGSNLNAAYSQWQTWPKVFRSVQMMIRPVMNSVLSNCEPKHDNFLVQFWKWLKYTS
ncbi:fibrinogen C domain-containing protein 1-like [Drosophila innubila]|uniref:fibrinogen C domain-containing protein 1-like n=1 Tax=Drosophila innubila TaxID=198719 RepID=UPI00148E8F0F|nr:fibrinogen C domain-containing protein 1-like [Drosophila innubila]